MTTVILDDEQEQIREVARRYLQAEYDIERVRELAAGEAGFDPDRWAQIAELGWTGIAIPESAGGMGYGLVEQCLLLEEMGRVLMPAPYLSSVVFAGSVLLSAGGSPDGAALLAQLASGERRAALAVPGADVDELTVDATGALRGSAGLVLDAQSADVLVVAARTAGGDVGVYACETTAEGVSIVAQAVVDPTRRMADVAFDGAAATRLDDGDRVPERLAAGLARATVGLAAEMAGAIQRCVDDTIEYVRDREQFGRPVGSFQAIKHRCADMGIEADTAREAVLLAADVIESGDLAAAATVASMAKAVTSDALLHVAAEMIQMHGGIGYTEEHSAHLFYKRALHCAQLLGSAVDHRDRLARSLDV